LHRGSLGLATHDDEALVAEEPAGAERVSHSSHRSRASSASAHSRESVCAMRKIRASPAD
jgi:hypothetical protein